LIGIKSGEKRAVSSPSLFFELVNISTPLGAPAQTATTMSDFLSRENDILGGEFVSGSRAGPSDLDIDFDRAASAFPDISLDGSGDIPTSSAAPSMNRNVSSGFSFDDFETRDSFVTDVKVTGDDEIEKFEDQFPDIGTPQVRYFEL
jgi:hypothetical protein